MRLPKVYFFVQPISKMGYQHNAIGMAQGMRELGITFGANTDYWREADGNILFKQDPALGPNDADILILTEQYLTYGDGKFPQAYFDAPGKKVFISTGDGMVMQKQMFKPIYKKFDLILTFIYEGIPYPKNFRPWAYGMTNHMISLSRPDLPKEDKICLNYRNSHSVRQRAKEWVFDKLDQRRIDTTRETFDWEPLEHSKDFSEYVVWQSAGRHNEAYLDRIGRSLATSAFGGDFFIKPSIWGWYTWKFINYFVESAASIGRMNNIAKKIGLHTDHTYRIYQWDSWRIWEAFAAKSMAVNVDFEKYRIRLPEMPVNFQHYLGVDLRNPQKAIDVLNDPEKMKEIGAAGYDWAMQHYAPKALAQRLLRYVDDLKQEG
ncbi:MAG: hypothetical protein IPN95_15835 [Bacteroidetes bacterium]|nr:hypothetical protein [Bacteroidota bacterium]MBP6638653.1 hypothetical protein [Bacteroidia bacterium]